MTSTCTDSVTQQVVDALRDAVPGYEFSASPLVDRGKEPAGPPQFYVAVPADKLLAAMRVFYDDSRCDYKQLCDVTCVDYSEFPKARDRYGVTYSLHSHSRHHRFWVKCFVNDPKPEVPSVAGIWKCADWLEREVWDLFGVRFTGHPDLRRIMTWEAFEAHPLRKDYPLQGRGEREDYPTLTRESR